VGPAVVFRYSWDLEGALQTIYHDPTLRADIVSSRLSVEEEGLSDSLYGEIFYYEYGDNLLVYHVGSKVIRPVINAETARYYFQAFNPDYKNVPDPEESRRAFGTFNPDPINVCP
jgi:hypothetical protein